MVRLEEWNPRNWVCWVKEIPTFIIPSWRGPQWTHLRWTDSRHYQYYFLSLPPRFLRRLVQRKPSDGDLGFRFLVTSLGERVMYAPRRARRVSDRRKWTVTPHAAHLRSPWVNERSERRVIHSQSRPRKGIEGNGREWITHHQSLIIRGGALPSGDHEPRTRKGWP